MSEQPPWQPHEPSYEPYGQSQWGQQPPPPQYGQYPQQMPNQYSGWDPNQYQQSMLYQQPPLKKPFFRYKIALGLGCGLFMIMFICGIIGVIMSAAMKNAGTATVNSTTSSSSSSDNNVIAKVGQMITIQGVQATLLSVKTSPGDQFNQPKTGNEYVIVNVKLSNTNYSERTYNPFDFHVKSGSGDITNEEGVGFESNNQLNSGTLAPGGTTQGEMVFQAPKGDHKAELTWQPSIFGQAGVNGWLLGL